MKEIFHLLKPHVYGFNNRLFHTKTKGRKRAIVLCGLGAFFFCSMFIISSRILSYFQSMEIIGDVLARHLLSMILLIFFSMLIFSHIISSLSNLYLSRDLDLFFAAPVAVEKLFVSRFFLTILDSSWMIMIFGAPVFLAYGYVYHPGLQYYLTLIHLNLAMIVIAAGIGVLITMVLVNVIPARKTKDFVMFFALFIILVLCLMFRFLRPEKLVDPGAFLSTMEYISAMKTLQSPYLPTRWITDILWQSLYEAEGHGSGFKTLLTWFTAFSFVTMNIWLAQAIYFKGFSKSQEARKRKKTGKRLLDILPRWAGRPFGVDLGAIVTKDIRIFFRDNTQWSQLLLLGALVVVYVYNFAVLPLEKGIIQLEFLQIELAFLNMGLAGFVLSAISARFVFTCISTEGQAYWVIRASPLWIGKYLWGKFIFYLLPTLMLAETLMILTNYYLHVTELMMAISIGTMLLLVPGIVALGVGLGAVYPDFNANNAAKISTGFGGVLYMILSMVFIAVVIGIEAGPVYIIIKSRINGTTINLYQWVFIGISFLTVFSITGLMVYKPIKMGTKALQENE